MLFEQLQIQVQIHREDQHDVTSFKEVSVQGVQFFSTRGASCKHISDSQHYPIDRMLWFSWIYLYLDVLHDRLCGLVVKVPGYRSRGPGSIPATRFSEK
jgi:hypothetical protein